MDFNFSIWITILSTVAGLLSILATFITLLRTRLKEARTLEEINEKVFAEAISSSNIKLLGNYLDNNLGAITIREYTSNKKIQKKVNNYLQDIITFIGTEEEIRKAEVPMPETETFLNYEVPDELRPVINELRLGQPWNALAQLRRYIEITLRNVIQEYKVETGKFIPPIQILSMLSTMQVISQTAVRDLKYAISICNKAIHGLDTTQEEAEEAIQLAIKGLGEIKRRAR